jgi:pyruvate dehydrogenase E2 component (dihydrolipoamide acetyltransferase)
VAIDVIMPQMGADMTEGTLVKWVKQVGESVARGDVLAEIETDKATVELEAFESGTLLKTVVAEGETVPVGQVIALLGEAGEAVAADTARMPRPAAAERKMDAAPAAAAPRAEPALAGAAPRAAVADAAPPANGRVRISPVARRIAQDAGIDPAAVAGSGPDGRVLRRDVEAALRPVPGAASTPTSAAPTPAPAAPAPVATAQPAPTAPSPVAQPVRAVSGELRAAYTVEPLSRMRQAIARRMVQSKQQQPHYYLTLDIDMTEALAFRERVNTIATEAQRVSINDLVVKAVALALVRHPKFNGEFTDEGLRLHPAINIDIAIALDEGLIAPCVLDCANKTLGRIAQESKDLVARAKSGHLRAEEISEGTFGITNLGAFGVETLIGIIKPPQAAILGVGSVLDQAVVRAGQVVPVKMMKVALSADHRVTDGAEGARFIKEIQGFLENPISMAL